MLEVQCPVTGEISTFPSHRGLLAQRMLSLSTEFQIPIEELWAMTKVVAERGIEWLPDAVEVHESWLQAVTDKNLLEMARKGEWELSIFDLVMIRDRARASLQLLLRNERDPVKRQRIEKMLEESEVSKANRALALAMLEEKRRNDA